MNQKLSWLTTSYSGSNYESEEDPDPIIVRRRKAISELKNMLREKCMQQILEHKM